jgi:hypothetical protein
MDSVALVTSQTTSYAVGWGTLSLINAGLAQSKNRSGLVWWFVSLFLGPVATFLIVVLDRVEPTERFGSRSQRTPRE